jgi:hypothetical protein
VHLHLDGPDVPNSDFLLVLIELFSFSINIFICQEGKNVGLNARKLVQE